MKKCFVNIGIALLIIATAIGLYLHAFSAAWISGFWEDALVYIFCLAGFGLVYLIISVIALLYCWVKDLANPRDR